MKIESLYKIFPYFIIAFFVVSCASSGTLSGGPKDTSPPKIIKEKSSKSILTEYDGQEIVMVFDEFVEIRNKKEIVVSPPTNYPIIVKQRGKKVKIRFDKREQLKPNATYYIGLDKTVRDFTEGNELPFLSFVLSEDSVIDSAEYKGKITYPDDVKKDLRIMMYKTDKDSIPALEKPDYYTKSNEGNFKFKYIKNGTYKVVAFEDKNLNLIYDQNTDWVAFMDTTLVVKDSTKEVVLNAFLPEQPLKIIKKNNDDFGTFSLEYNQSIENVNCKVLSDSMPVFFTYDDTRIIGKYNFKKRNLKMLCGTDTVKIKLPRVDSTLFKNKLTISKGENQFSPLEDVVIKWDAPLQSLNSDSISITTTIDTLDTKVNASLSFRNDSIIIKGLESGKKYKALFDSLATVDIYDRVNDSLTYNFEILPDSALVDIKIKLDSTFAERQSKIIVSLLSKNKHIATKEFDKNKSVTFSKLKPLKYTFKVVEDDNNDGKWTTGNYWKKRQPERTITVKKAIDKNGLYYVNWDKKELYQPSDNSNTSKQSLEKGQSKTNSTQKRKLNSKKKPRGIKGLKNK